MDASFWDTEVKIGGGARVPCELEMTGVVAVRLNILLKLSKLAGEGRTSASRDSLAAAAVSTKSGKAGGGGIEVSVFR